MIGHETSVERRLLSWLLIGATLIWAGAIGASIWHVAGEIDELFDTDQIRVAQQVLLLGELAGEQHELTGTGDGASAAANDSSPDAVRPEPNRADPEELAITVWHADGRLLGRLGSAPAIPFRATGSGFETHMIDGLSWRVYYRSEPGVDRVVAVSQQLEERGELVWGLVLGQILPWLLTLPILAAVIDISVRVAFRPLRELARELEERTAAELDPVPLASVPVDVKPLVRSMNALFERIREALDHERRLTADASHELRTPLAALRAQWDAARLADSGEAREAALAKVGEGIDRLGRLVSQLLNLAALDAQPDEHFVPMVDWRRVTELAVNGALTSLDEADTELQVEGLDGESKLLPIAGNEALLGMMLRNLLENAARHGRPRSTIHVRFAPERIEVEDEGPGLDPEVMARVGARFYRPAGQRAVGSGIGLSIVMRVAKLHRLVVRLENRVDGNAARCGLRVVIERASIVDDREVPAGATIGSSNLQRKPAS